ncbi:hypothetical protein Bbelb_260600 [Branchiostoma belcheri]|nr:hypothetical protein Bbelb_260600 [Branchiostoma belcheri]
MSVAMPEGGAAPARAPARPGPLPPYPSYRSYPPAVRCLIPAAPAAWLTGGTGTRCRAGGLGEYGVLESRRCAFLPHVVAARSSGDRSEMVWVELRDPHRVLDRNSALELMKKNLKVFEDQARLASKQGAQIIVFPEDGIYGMGYTRQSIFPFLEEIPDPSLESWNPCVNPDQHSETEVLHILSCIARNNSIVVVANMGDKQNCSRKEDPNCPDNNRYQFNTDVCVLLKCHSNSHSSCGTGTTSAGTAFSFLHMAGNFSTSYVYPEVTTDGVSLAPPSEWKYEAQAIRSTEGLSKPLLSAGLYGRWYDRD